MATVLRSQNSPKKSFQTIYNKCILYNEKICAVLPTISITCNIMTTLHWPPCTVIPLSLTKKT